MGKTSLVAAALAAAGPASGLVVVGGGVDVPGVDGLRSPFEVLAEGVRSLAHDPSARETVRAAARKWLTPPSATSTRRLDPAAARQEDLLTLLEAQGEHGPVTVVLEDLHWADEASLGALVFLTRHLTGHLVRLVATARPPSLAGPPGPHAHVLEYLRVHAGAVVVDLGPLGERDVAVLVRPVLGSRSADQVVQLAEGNPLAALVMATRADGSAPASIDLAVKDQWARLPTGARRLLAAAAVIGEPVPHPMLRELAGPMTPTQWEGARDAALGSGLIRPRELGYGWWHALHRLCVYRLVDVGERADLHAAAARYLEAAQALGGAAAVARHWAQAGHQARAGAAHLRAGLEAAAQGAYVEARSHVAEGLRLWVATSGDGLPVSLPVVVDVVRDSVHATGQIDQGVTLLQRLVELARGDDQARALTALAVVRASLADLSGAQAAFDAATGAAVTGKGRGHVLVWHAAAMAMTQPLEAGRLATDGLVELGHGDSSDLVYGLVTRGAAAGLAGERRAAAADLGRAGFVAARVHDEKAEWYVLMNAMNVFMVCGMRREAVHAAHAAITKARSGRLLRSFAAQAALGNAAETMMWVGAWDEGLALVREVWGDFPPASGAALPLSLAKARILTRRGEDEALTLLTQLDPMLTGRTVQAAAAHGLRAQLLAYTADRQGALAQIEAGVSLCSLDEPGIVGPEAITFVCDALVVAVDALADPTVRRGAAGLVAELGRARAVVLGAVDVSGSPYYAALDGWAGAEVARSNHLDDPDVWAQQERAWSGMGDPYRVAYARYRRAEAHLRGGDRRAAAHPLAQAFETALELRAQPLYAAVMAAAQRARVALGGRRARVRLAPEVPDGAYRVGLTRRECDVLEHLVDGRSDRQIARTLGISQRTVEVHVSHILAKLGVTSRGEATAVTHRLGLLSPAGAPPGARPAPMLTGASDATSSTPSRGQEGGSHE